MSTIQDNKALSFRMSQDRAGLTAGSIDKNLVALFFGLCAAVGFTTWISQQNYLPVWIASIANGVLLYFLAQINHEAFHRNVSGTDHQFHWLNDAMGHFISFIFWFSFPAFKAMHLAHHRHMNQPDRDADMWVSGRNGFSLLFACLTHLQRYEYQLWKDVRLERMDRKILIQFYLERLLGVAIVFAGFRLGIGKELLFYWLLPAFGVLPVIVLLFTYVVHYPHSEHDALEGTNVILAPTWLLPFVTWLFAFQNYHLIHHLFPRIPFYRLGSEFRRMRPALEESGAKITHL